MGVAGFILTVFGASISALSARAVPPTVTNVRAVQSRFDRQVEITYHLADPDSAKVQVSLRVSEDGGGTWSVPATSLEGFGYGDSVVPGQDRSILWNAPTDWPGRKSNLVRFRVVVNDDPIPVNMSRIPAGSFQMGNSTNSGEGYSDELPVHPVYVSAFYMDRYEVTKALWDEVRAWGLTNGYTDLPVGGGKAASHPVQMISWYAMVKWCNARSQKEGLTPVYFTNDAQTTIYQTGSVDASNAKVKWGANGYRLPTEAEWEKAARGGLSAQRFPWGETISHEQANYDSTTGCGYDVSPTRGYHPTYAVDGEPNSSPVGSFAPNVYGLYDMVGNVGEWCWDQYEASYYSTSSGTDPQGPPPGPDRVLRGGSWLFNTEFCRVASRFSVTPSEPSDFSGFRSVRR